MTWFSCFKNKKQSTFRPSTTSFWRENDKRFFIQALESYILQRNTLAEGNRNHHKHYFFCIGLGFSAGEKTGAAQKMIDALQHKSVHFTYDDIRALQKGDLGKIVKRYADLDCLPASFVEDKKNITMRIELRALFGRS